MIDLAITPYLYVPFVAWLCAQLIKLSLKAVMGDADLKYLYASGGMPSSHSAVVCSLAAYTLFQQGFMSPLFGVTAVIAGIVMYDSFGVRRSSGEQAKTVNKLIDDMLRNGNIRNSEEYGRVREILGHQPLEVLAGAILGVLIAGLFSLDKLTEFFNWFSGYLNYFGNVVVLVSGGLMIVGSIIGYFMVRKRIKSSKPKKKMAQAFLVGNLVTGALLLLYTAISVEKITPYGQVWLVSAIYVLWAVFLSIILYSWKKFGLKNASVEDDRSPRKQEWLNKAQKRKKIEHQ